MINCFKKKINDDYHDKAPCPSLVTQTSKGVFRWNSTTDQIIKQNCLYGGSVATHECKTASWININVSQCDYESNLTRYLNSLLNPSSNVSFDFNLKSIFNYQLINRLIEGRRNYQQNGKCLIEFYNFISNQTQFDSVFLDFNVTSIIDYQIIIRLWT